MASLVFENKVKAWEKSRLEVRKYISDPQFAEQDGYFSEVEQMAFGGSFKKKSWTSVSCSSNLLQGE